VALTHAELEARYPDGPSAAYRAAADRAPAVLPGELGGVIAAVMRTHATMRDMECSERRLNPRSWLISAGAPNALAAVLLEPEEEPVAEQTPSVGRIVHYVSYGTPGDEYPSACRAAIVTEVFDNRVGLCVLNPTGQFFNREVPYDESGASGGTWHWPERV
jgi:hypothetical protein